MRFRLSQTPEAPWQSHAETLDRLCQQAGIYYGFWLLPEALDGKALLGQAALQSKALALVAEPLEQLKQRFAYTSADIVGLTSDTPNLDTLLAAFEREHHHSDDEVRVLLYGTGVFGLCPSQSPAFELELSAGDWLVLPAYTRHWFTLGQDKTALALRVFKNNPQWQAIY